MSSFEEVIEARARGARVRVIDLVFFDFKSGPQFWHRGEHSLTTKDGRVWQPTRGVGTIGGLEQAYDGEAPEITLELAGTSPKFKALAIAARKNKAEFYDRLVQISWQFMGDNWQPYDLPFAIVTGLMRSIEMDRKTVPGGVMTVFSITAENPFANRSSAPNGSLTPQAQDALYPSAVRDEILDRSPGSTQRRVDWPDF